MATTTLDRVAQDIRERADQLRGELDLALPLALRAAGELERTVGPDHAETLNALANLAQLQLARGEKAQAEALLRRVHATRERVLGKSEEATLEALLELAIFLKKEGRLRVISRTFSCTDCS